MISFEKIFYFLLILPVFIKAQVFKAGDIFPGYIDINPDTLINYKYAHNFTSTESYYFDMNNDLQNDFEINAYSSNGLGGGANFISIIPLNTNSFSAYSRTDSASYYNNNIYYIRADVAKPLNLSDTINTLTSIWKNTTLSITNNNRIANGYLNVTDWIGTNDHFIGLMYQSLNDTLYGWIRVNCPSRDSCYIKDYSFSKCLSVPPMAVTSSDSLSCASESVVLTANGASTYTWSNGNTGSSITVIPDTTTTYTIQGINMYGCSAGTATFTQNVDACAGIKEYGISGLNIYPNPVTDILQILNQEYNFKQAELIVINNLGLTVLRQPYSNSIDVSKLISFVFGEVRLSVCDNRESGRKRNSIVSFF